MEVLATSARLRDGTNVLLRSPRAADAAAALVYMRELSRQSHENLGNPPAVYEAMTEEDEAGFIEMQLHHPKSFLVCAFIGDAIVGSAGIRGAPAQLNAHTGELGIGVLEQMRGKGLGKALLERVLAFGAANGITNVHLRVRAENAQAIRLYERLGFTKVGTLVGVARLADGDRDEHIYQRIV